MSSPVDRDTATSFAALLQERAQNDGDRQAFVYLDRHAEAADQRTYAELDAAARRIAAALSRLDVQGVPVLLLYPSCLEFVEALFGCFYAGGVAVPAPYVAGRRTAERTAAICRDCGPRVVLSLSQLEREAGLQESLTRDRPDLQFIYTDTIDATPDHQALPQVPAASLAMLQYTSGSTSSPKGVMLSHANLLANSAMIRDAMGHDSALRGVGWLPLFHDMGLVGHVLQPVFTGGLSVLLSPLTVLQRPWTWLKAVSDWRATTSGGPNYAFDLCARPGTAARAGEVDLSSWSVAYCGSEPVRPGVLARFAERFADRGFDRAALYPCYGLAEATLMAAGPRRATGMHILRRMVRGTQRALTSCGAPPAGTELIVVDPETLMRTPPGTAGEIWLKGPHVGMGYWRQPQESEFVFRARPAAGEGEYLRTGDLGFIEDGRLYVIGRTKDLIIIRGMNHAPEDIEESVAASDPAFGRQAQAAFAIDTPGEEGVVVVQEFRPGGDGRGPAPAVLEAASERVTHDHGVRLYDLVLVRPGAIPRTSSGKVRRQRCREIYQAGEFARLNDKSALKSLGVNMSHPAEARPGY